MRKGGCRKAASLFLPALIFQCYIGGRCAGRHRVVDFSLHVEQCCFIGAGFGFAIGEHMDGTESSITRTRWGADGFEVGGIGGAATIDIALVFEPLFGEGGFSCGLWFAESENGDGHEEQCRDGQEKGFVFHDVLVWGWRCFCW